ncbi:MAG: hypothetical protein RJB41_1089 [Actinomycetota bacterium]|jgi:hypothetical protein
MSQQAVIHDINQIGNLMADQPEKTKDSPATVQDLRNMGIAIDANFMLIRSEAKTESALLRSEAKTESALLRSEMATGFAKVDVRFTTIDAEFKTVRSEMKTGFSDAKESLTRWSMGIFFSVVALVIAVVGSILFR